MRNKIITVLAVLLKIYTIVYLISYAFESYDASTNLYSQDIMVWLLIYLPLFMGYESLVNIILSKRTKKPL